MAVAALTVGLTGVIGSGHRAGTFRTAAFTLVDYSDGTAALTINPLVLLDPGTLQSDLNQDGLPAKVTVGSFCSSDPMPAGLSQVVSSGSPAPPGNGPVANPVITIDPSAMPAETELSVGSFQAADSQQTSLTLVSTDSYTCASTPPALDTAGVVTLANSSSAP